LKKETLYKILIFTLLTYGSIVLYRIYLEQKNIAPRLSDSGSFDVKMWHLKHTQVKEIDILGIGSSLTYFDLNTSVLLKSIPPDLHYYNFASWHFTVRDIDRISQFIGDYIQPKVLLWIDSQSLYTTEAIDEEKNIPSSVELDLYFTGIFSEYSYLKGGNLDGLIKYTKWMNEELKKKDKKLGNQSLDMNGGTYIVDHRKLSSGKEYNNDGRSYTYLEKVCSYFKRKNITILYVNMPSPNQKYHDKTTASYIKAHDLRVSNIIKKNGHLFCSKEQVGNIPDSLYADNGHLNKCGGEWFTKKIMAFPSFKNAISHLSQH